MSSGWVGFDLDGTVAEYEIGDYSKNGHAFIGKPIPRTVARIQQYLADGMEVRIFTARVWYPEGNMSRKTQALESRLAITEWCEKHIGQPLKVTCQKDYDMIRLYDDRCVQVEPNTGRLTAEQAYDLGYANGKADGKL